MVEGPVWLFSQKPFYFVNRSEQLLENWIKYLGTAAAVLCLLHCHGLEVLVDLYTYVSEILLRNFPKIKMLG